MDSSDEKFVKQAKALFDDSVDGLDGATLSTLTRSRHRALAAAGGYHPALWRWVPVTGVAAAVLVGVMVTQPDTGGVDALPANVDDMEILLGEDSIEMLENLEFYALFDALEQNDDVG